MGQTQGGRWSGLRFWRPGLAIVLAIAGVVFIAFFAVRLLNEMHVRHSGRLVTARVLDVHMRIRPGSTADVRFVTEDGTPVSAELDIDAADPFPQRDDRIEVRYLPEDPAGSAVVADADRISYWLRVVAAVLVAGWLAARQAYWVARQALRPPPEHLAGPN